MSEESNVQSTAQAVAQLAHEIPVYQDAVQPSAQALGQGFGGALRWLMQPLMFLGIRAEENTKKFQEEYEKKLSAIPEGQLKSPDPIVVGPALQSLLYTMQEDDLRAMFVNLLASASDARKSSNTHPAFVDIIKQLSIEEANLLSRNGAWGKTVYFVTHSSDEMGRTFRVIDETDPNDLASHESAIDNLLRLQIYEYVNTRPLITDLSTIGKIKGIFGENVKEVDGLSGFPRTDATTWARYQVHFLRLTAFGRNFIETCVS